MKTIRIQFSYIEYNDIYKIEGKIEIYNHSMHKIINYPFFAFIRY
jgi:hypothetical protein